MNSQEPLDIPTFQLGNLAQEYAIDLWQRSLLYADVMRERGNQYQEHLAEAAPHVLSFKAEPVMFGSRLERPVNYVLARIIPPEGADIDPRKRPFVVVDPRAASEPPAVGVVEAVRRPVTDTYEFMGRVQATDRVDLLARVNGFLEQQLFIEGAEVKDGDLLYRLEQPPYQADLEAKQAAVAQAEAQLANADIQLRRAKDLLRSPAGTQARYDDALTAKLSAAAQLRSAKATERQSEINLGYTEIGAPIAGRISRGSVTIGNVVGPRGPCDDVPARGDRQAETGTWLYADGSLGAPRRGIRSANRTHYNRARHSDPQRAPHRHHDCS